MSYIFCLHYEKVAKLFYSVLLCNIEILYNGSILWCWTFRALRVIYTWKYFTLSFVKSPGIRMDRERKKRSYVIKMTTKEYISYKKDICYFLQLKLYSSAQKCQTLTMKQKENFPLWQIIFYCPLFFKAKWI